MFEEYKSGEMAPPGKYDCLLYYQYKEKKGGYHEQSSWEMIPEDLICNECEGFIWVRVDNN
jgi:hypothetical protein